MASGCSTQKNADRRSAFGFLRLLFASLVIVSHAPELADGDRSREPLTQIFGTISFGELAVDCFFIISGYLIVGSYLQYPRVVAYVRKRVARIYPAFVVASLVSLAIVAPLAGADMGWVSHNPLLSGLRIVLLQQPDVPHAFVGQAQHEIDGPMWTISYEFRCYLLVLLFGSLGLLRRPPLVFALALLLFVAFECLPVAFCGYIDQQIRFSEYWLGASHHTLRFTALFLVGAVFYLERQRIRFSGKGIIAAMVLLGVCMFSKKLAEPAVAIFGGYIIFATAAWGASRRVGTINDKNDVSYGVYLYAWPISQLLVRYCPGLPVAVQGMITLAAAMCCGWLSWKLIEQPSLRAVSSRRAATRVSNTERGSTFRTPSSSLSYDA